MDLRRLPKVSSLVAATPAMRSLRPPRNLVALWTTMSKPRSRGLWRRGLMKVSVRIGEAGGNRLGKNSLLDFQVGIALEGDPLSEAELKAILQSASGFVLLKGKWVEVDQAQLQQVLDHWKKDNPPPGLAA